MMSHHESGLAFANLLIIPCILNYVNIFHKNFTFYCSSLFTHPICELLRTYFSASRAALDMFIYL